MMGPDGVATRESMEQQPFIDRHWLFYNGPLRRDTVLEYFALSKFYDRTSSNEELRTQGAKDIRQEHMVNMVGVQYYAEEVEGLRPDQPIFIVYKVLRSSRHKQQVLDVYYVMDGMVYQAPTILSVLRSRLRRCAYMLNSAHNALAGCVEFSMGQGEAYRFAAPGSGGEEGKPGEAEGAVQPDGEMGEMMAEGPREGEVAAQGEDAQQTLPKGPSAPHHDNAAVMDRILKDVGEGPPQVDALQKGMLKQEGEHGAPGGVEAGTAMTV